MLFNIIYSRIKHALAFYKTWGFKKVLNPYSGEREYTMPQTSWLCKAQYLGFGYEFWWSPGGGFSDVRKSFVLNIFIIVLMSYCCLMVPIFAIFLFLIYEMIIRMV